MKRFTVILICLASAFSLYAAEWATSEGSCFAKGQKNISGGMSLGYFGVFVLGEYAFHDAISAGIATGYNGTNYSFYFRYNYIPIVARAAFHPFNLSVLSDKINIRDKLDPYVGLASGWSIGWATERKGGYPGSDPSVGHFTFRELFGVKFYPSANAFFLTAEEAGGLSWFNFGVGIKF